MGMPASVRSPVNQDCKFLYDNRLDLILGKDARKRIRSPQAGCRRFVPGQQRILPGPDDDGDDGRCQISRPLV